MGRLNLSGNVRLGGILLLGLCLRCINLSTRSIQYDDAFSFFLARRDWANIITGTSADTMPPLYYFLLHVWLQFSQDIAWLRLLSVILSLLGVVFLYLLVKKLAGQPAGLWAAFFAAISPLQIYHAQDLRMYALLAAAQLGYCYFFISAITEKSQQMWKWAGVVLCGTLAMYSHNLAIFVLVVPNLILIVGRSWRSLLNLFIAQGLIGLFSIPWLILVPGQVEKIQRAFWTPQPGVVEVIQAILTMTTNLPLDGIWFVIGAVISLELIVLIFWLLARNRMQQVGFLLWFFLVPPVALFITSYIMRPVFVPRGFIASTLAYLGIAGVVISQLKHKVFKGLIASGFILATLIALPYQLSFEQFPRSQYQKALGAISRQITTGERIIHDNKLSFFPSHFYAPHLDQRFIADEPGSFNDTYAPASQAAIGLIPDTTLDAASYQAPGIYFVTYQKTIEEYQTAGLVAHPSMDYLASKYRLVDKFSTGDLWIFHFRREP